MNDFQDNDPVVCITHNDLDGLLCGYLVKQKYPQARVYYNNYGRDVMNQAFVQGAKMFVTDFSLSMFEYEKARKAGMQVIWIDHHKSNYERLQTEGMFCEGLRRDDRCGAYLVFQYLNPGVQEIPDVIKLVDDYDRWQFKDKRTMSFTEGMKIYETRPTMKSCHIWDLLFNPDKELAEKTLKTVISIGERIHYYIATHNRVMCNELSFKTQFNGANVLVANTKQTNSTFFDSADKTGLDALSVIQYAPDIQCFRGSFYSADDVKNVIHLAESLGGGGHPKAAGFHVPKFPFEYDIRTDLRDLQTVISEYRTVLNLRSDPAVLQAATKSDSISLRSATFKADFLGMECFAINHPYITELVPTFPACVDVVSEVTGNIIDVFVGFVLTGKGVYRNQVYTPTARVADKIKSYLKSSQDVIGSVYEEPSVVNYNVSSVTLHWYSKEPAITIRKGY